jgi:hypothetical protein
MKEMPYLDGSLQRWIRKVAVREHWRVKERMSIDDLEAEAYLCWSICWRQYNGLFNVPNPTIKQRNHFGQLFMTSYIRHIYRLAKLSSKLVRTVPSNGTPTSSDTLGFCPEPEYPCQELVAHLRRMPEGIARTFEKVIEDAETGAPLSRSEIWHRYSDRKKVLAYLTGA